MKCQQMAFLCRRHYSNFFFYLFCRASLAVRMGFFFKLQQIKIKKKGPNVEVVKSSRKRITAAVVEFKD